MTAMRRARPPVLQQQAALFLLFVFSAALAAKPVIKLGVVQVYPPNHIFTLEEAATTVPLIRATAPSLFTNLENPVWNNSGWERYSSGAALLEPSSFAYEIAAATRFAVHQVNADPHVLPNHTLELVEESTGFIESYAAMATLNVMSSAGCDRQSAVFATCAGPRRGPVRVVVGYLSSGGALASAPLSNAFSVPIVLDWASSPLIVKSGEFPFVSRTTPDDLLEGRALAHMLRRMGMKQFVTITTSDGSAQAVVDELVDEAASFGIVATQQHLLSTKPLDVFRDDSEVLEEARAILLRIRDPAQNLARTRAIVLSTFSFSAVTFLQLAESLGMVGKESPFLWIGTKAWLFSQFNLSTSSKGILGTAHYLNLTNFDTMRTAWRQMAAQGNVSDLFGFSEPRPDISPMRYDTVRLAARALHEEQLVRAFCAEPQNNVTLPNLTFTSNPWDIHRLDYTCAPFASSDLKFCCYLEYGRIMGITVDGILFTELLRSRASLEEGASGSINIGLDGDVRGGRVRFVNFNGSALVEVGFFETNETSTLAGPAHITWSERIAVEVATTGAYPLSTIPTAYRLDAPSRSAQEALSVLASLTATYTLFWIWFNVYYRQHPIVKLSSPILNLVLLGGVLIITTFLFLYIWRFELTESAERINDATNDQFVQYCDTQIWVLALSFSITFGALFAKIWRAYELFFSAQLMRKVSRDSELLGFVLFLVAMDVIVLLPWQLTGMSKRQITPSARSSVGDIVFATVECVVEESLPAIVLLLVNFVLIVFGAWLAWTTRNVDIKELNDSRAVGLSIYSLIASSAITTVVANVGGSPTAVMLVNGISILIGFCVVQSLMFVPKLIAVRAKVTKPRRGSEKGPGALQLVERNRGLLSDNRRLTEQIDKLRRQLDSYQSQLEKASGSTPQQTDEADDDGAWQTKEERVALSRVSPNSSFHAGGPVAEEEEEAAAADGGGARMEKPERSEERRDDDEEEEEEKERKI